MFRIKTALLVSVLLLSVLASSQAATLSEPKLSSFVGFFSHFQQLDESLVSTFLNRASNELLDGHYAQADKALDKVKTRFLTLAMTGKPVSQAASQALDRARLFISDKVKKYDQALEEVFKVAEEIGSIHPPLKIA